MSERFRRAQATIPFKTRLRFVPLILHSQFSIFN